MTMNRSKPKSSKIMKMKMPQLANHPLTANISMEWLISWVGRNFLWNNMPFWGLMQSGNICSQDQSLIKLQKDWIIWRLQLIDREGLTIFLFRSIMRLHLNPSWIKFLIEIHSKNDCFVIFIYCNHSGGIMANKSLVITTLTFIASLINSRLFFKVLGIESFFFDKIEIAFSFPLFGNLLLEHLSFELVHVIWHSFHFLFDGFCIFLSFFTHLPKSLFFLIGSFINFFPIFLDFVNLHIFKNFRILIGSRCIELSIFKRIFFCKFNNFLFFLNSF